MIIKNRLIVVSVLMLLFLIGAYTAWEISRSRTFQFFGGVVATANTKEKVVALTFDDGPTKKNTEVVLKILAELEVKATFFVTGAELEQNLDEGKKIVAAGHELGNHSFSHQRMVLKSPSFIKEEIDRTDELIRKTGYIGDIHFRPPYGKKLVLLPYYLKQKAKKTILWDIEPETYPEVAESSEKIAEHVIDRVVPGSIILLHVMYDSRTESVQSIKEIVTSLREQGYTFKTVSELLEENKI